MIFYRDTSTAADAADSKGNNIFLNGIMKLQLYRDSYFQITITKMAP